MPSDAERVFEDAVRTGRENAHTVEMARRHCLNMTFTEFGGRGWAEGTTGLPINMRQVGCLVAHGGASGNLAWIAGEFYAEHCVGCVHRRPTGDVPNLATMMEEQKEAAARAEEAERAETARRRREWEQRVEHRRGAQTSSDTAMASALDDIGVLDREPGVERDGEAFDGALRRLTALAERAPETFSVAVIELALVLVAEVRLSALLTPLRHVARVRGEYAADVLEAALNALRRGPVEEAGRCVTDLLTLNDAGRLDEAVIRSLVYLAEPRTRRFGVYEGGTGDASALRAAAGAAPRAVAAVLAGMLPAPRPPESLVLPAGVGPTPRTPSEAETDRRAAAAAVRALAFTHADVAGQLVPPMLLNLGVDDGHHEDPAPVGTIQQALAALLVLEVGDVPAHLERAGRAAADTVRRRLFGALEQAGRLIDPEDRFRTASDPQPDESRQRAVFEYLLSTCLTRIGGDWGDDVRVPAAILTEQLAQTHPAWAQPHLTALLGTALTAIDTLESADTAPAPLLATPETASPELRFLDRMTYRQSLASSIGRLLDALEHIAALDATAVSSAVIDTIADERDSQRRQVIVAQLLPLLGKLGRRHGDHPGLLRLLLPLLYTYVVDSDVASRSAALSAWAQIGAAHRLPSSLSDLLPALLADPYLGVIDGVLDTAMRLEWSPQDTAALLAYALFVCEHVDADRFPDTVKKAMAAASRLSRSSETLRARTEQTILRRAADLDRYHLRDALSRDWLPQTVTTVAMATLRLRQVRDPAINDRFNAHDNRELCALLECGPGLAGLPVADLRAAALELGPHGVPGAAEYAEVAWRAARPSDAAAVMNTVLDRLPDQPAFAVHRAMASLVAAAAAFDAAAAARGDTGAAALALTHAAQAITGEGRAHALAEQARIRVTVRSLLAGRELVPVGGPDQYDADQRRSRCGDDPAALRARATRLHTAAKTLTDQAQEVTATAAYVRCFAKLCEVAAFLIKLDAAELDADTTEMTALATAARRRAAALTAELQERFTDTDPLAGELTAALERVQALTGADGVADLLADWAALPLPLVIAHGPRRTRRASRATAADNAQPTGPAEDESTVAVALASVDGRLITGPQVLRPSTVYELRLDVRTGPWPEWAETLEAELLSHLTPSEAETPSYFWPRPPRPDDPVTLSATGTLILRFGLPAGSPAPPFSVNLRWRGSRDGKPVTQNLDVAGHRQIRCRPFDASRDFLTNFPVFDERLLALYERLHHGGYDEDQLQAFCRLFTAICRTGLTMTWNKQYKRGSHVTERKFHDDLYKELLAEPELGGRLERGSPLALGYLDVRHDGITAELKVERKTPVTEQSAPKYMGQPTQYAAADGARLSILCILDMSRKTSPVGVPENYLFTLQPALHGLTNPEAPSLVAAIVVNGNLPTPSTWSRRRTPTQPDSSP
ncbi:hypothetical protein V2J94_37275 [Streptomyces sp. DSM 41524]|uniref:Protein NO VEIN C-terminal domain-containing protein n=1 Tax=Streptomyces asiaticus subsp. ignotus TaxID=3098222 RepID=A0ABU7Q7U3_9ACTN|nr:hypothetical protein [Streptomyces sp. DSM 41524]